MKKTNIDRKDNFSVALGLTDYVNPLLYCVTSVAIILHLNQLMALPWSAAYVLGVVISLIFGFTIPTVKLLVGLGKIEFSLPVNLVFYVNSGIFVSGLMLMKNLMNVGTLAFSLIAALSLLLLALIYRKTRKFNTVAVLIGAIGYLMIYISLISKSLSLSLATPVVFYGVAICLYLMLIGIGIKANLRDARVHWVIEISNIVCQASVAAGTILLMSGMQ